MPDQNGRKRALLMCLGDASWSPRTIRFASFLKQSGYHVTIASTPLKRGIDCDLHVALRQAPKPKGLFTRRLPGYAYFSAYLPTERLKDALNIHRHGLYGLDTVLQTLSFDLILVQDLALLPVALRMKKYARVVFDAREYYPAQEEDSWRFRVFERPERVRLCARDLPRCDGVLTVSQGLAHAYAKNFAVSPIVVHSASSFHDIAPSPVASDKIRLVYHGVANRNRGLPNLFRLMKQLRREFTLDLYLVTEDQKRLFEMQEMAEASGRIRLHAPVPFNSLIKELNQYDLGIIYYEPLTFNLAHCMPNKLFEYVQARLAIAIGPSPDMASFLSKYGCGVVARSFSVESLAEALNGLSPEDVAQLKMRSNETAAIVSMETELRHFHNALKSYMT